MSLFHPHMQLKERDEQQQTLSTKSQHIQELERQVKSGKEKLDVEKQKLVSIQEVGITVVLIYIRY